MENINTNSPINFLWEDDLTPAEITAVNNSINQWKNQNGGALRTENVKICKDAIAWVKSTGRFRSAGTGAPIGFAAAMTVGTNSLAAAFKQETLVGILAMESAFGTTTSAYTNADTAVGRFQIIPSKALADYNKINPQLTGQQIDGDGAEFVSAANVAAWYYAYNIQYLTNKKHLADEVGSIANAADAIPFAIAEYNKGIGAIAKARIACKTAGKDNTKWENVKAYLTGNDVGAKKYVARVFLFGAGLNIP